MDKKQKRNILLAATVLLLLSVGILLIPTAVEALPPEVRYRLPGSIAQIGVIPVAEDPLPAPASAAQVEVVGDLALPGVDAVATNTPEPVPTNTPEPVEEIVVDSAEPTATPLPPTETPTPAPTATPAPLPISMRLEGLENVPQSFNNCGPANLSVVLDFFGDPTTQTQAAEYLKPNTQDRNVSPWQISDYVNDFTSLSSTVHSGGELDMMKQLIAAGFAPVIERGVDFNDGNGWYGHYLTLFGYDDEREVFTAMDTNSTPWAPNGSEFTYDDIWESWRAFNYTFYVVHPPEKQDVVFAIVGEELLDDQSMWRKTIEIANADIATDPNDPYAWFNLGTAYTELAALDGDQSNYQQGAAAYDQARNLGLPQRMLWYQHRPYLAYFKVGRMQDVIDLAEATAESTGGQNVEETYLWLGHALSLTGDVDGAVDAYENALKLNENFYPAQWALDSLN
jgi:hypothetical protein